MALRHVVGCSSCTEQAYLRVKLANEVTFKRMADTMTLLKDTPETNLSSLAKILLGQSAPTKPAGLKDVKFFDETLNDSQKEAIRFSMSAPEIALIHGPPGVQRYLSRITIDG